MPNQSPEYRLEDGKIYRGKKQVATIENDSLSFESDYIERRYGEEIRSFLEIPTEETPPAEPKAEEKEKPAKPSIHEQLAEAFAPFAEIFEKVKPMARKIFFNKHAAFFEDHQKDFEAVFDFHQEESPANPSTKKKGFQFPEKHPDEPTGGKYGDAHPEVYDWRKEKWPAEAFRKKYVGRTRGVEAIRLELKALSDLDKMREFEANQDLTNPQIIPLAKNVSEAFKKIDLERKHIGATALLTTVEQLNNLTPANVEA